MSEQNEVVDRGTEIVLRATGEVFDATTASGVAEALARIRQYEEMISDAKREVAAAALDLRRLFAAASFPTDWGTLTVGSDEQTVYDHDVIEQHLRAAGAPEQLIRDVVVETVTTSYRVDARKAQAASRMNLAYRDAIAAGTHTVPQRPSVGLKRSS